MKSKEDARKNAVFFRSRFQCIGIFRQAAWSRIACDKEEHKVYARIVAKNPKKKKIATVACMRRLGVRMWRLALEAQLHAGVYLDKKLPQTQLKAG